MIERIVENWLTSASERAFQIPFAQVLASVGHRILHLSRHGVGEQGKDIISQHLDGSFHAYQLKYGDINKAKWQSIFGEIQELIELPLQYPTPMKTGNHTPILVTNGVISDDVRLSVQSLNQGNEKRGFSQLQVISLHELTGLFIKAHGSFLPIGLSDLKAFLDLYNIDGHLNLDRHKFSAYLALVLESSKVAGRADAQRRVTAAVLLATYLLRNISAAKNHVAACEAWALVQAYVLRFAHLNGLELADLAQTVSLLQESIDRELLLLKEEVLNRNDNYVEGMSVGDGGLMYTIRLTIVLGWLAAQECILSLRLPDYAIDARIIALIEKNLRSLGIWSEYSVPFMTFICIATRMMGDSDSAQRLLADMLRAIISLNNGRLKGGFPDPYHTPDDLISSFYSVPGKEIDLSHFAGSSYTFRALIDGLVFMDRRDLLEPMWKQVVETRSIEYYPTDPWDMLLWNSTKGQERDYGYERFVSR